MVKLYLLGFLLSLGLLCVVMPLFIKALKSHDINQHVSEYALDEYKNKAKTPIMGGLLFVVIPVIVYTILDINGFCNHKLLFVLLSYLLFSFVGFLDDILIVLKGSNDGVSPTNKLIMEFIFALGLYIGFKDVISCVIIIPFSTWGIDIFYLYIPFMILLFLAESNAANFTDGMDGLCAGVSFIGLLGLLFFLFRNNEGSLCLFIICILGGLIGYLFFNYHPAKIFMGDSGSLALGALFASIAIVLKLEVALLFISFVFVVEMFCVFTQRLHYKLFHKRIFSYTPIHYAYIIKGYTEKQIVPVFYLIQIVTTIIGIIVGLNS